ncbi:hypothetical protein ACOME3_001563 [Neoechinorhynchus agilis]
MKRFRKARDYERENATVLSLQHHPSIIKLAKVSIHTELSQSLHHYLLYKYYPHGNLRQFLVKNELSNGF